jgi:hypothetical protein
MAGNFDNLFEQLLTALQTAERRHRAVRDSASDNSDWDTLDNEVAIISNIIKWRRSLEPLRTEIMAAGAVSDEDVPIQVMTSSDVQPVSVGAEITPEQAEMPSRSDDERIGRYVWQKMKGLSNSGFTFSAEDIANLQNAQWCYQVLNIPYPFFLQTTEEVRYYWKRDIFVFNGKSFRLCMIWYNDLYRGRSQRECFDNWYDALSADMSATPVIEDEEVKVGKHIRGKLRELSNSGFECNRSQPPT